MKKYDLDRTGAGDDAPVEGLGEDAVDGVGVGEDDRVRLTNRSYLFLPLLPSLLSWIQ